MLFLGARGSTSRQLNQLLHLNDLAIYNPHQLFKNVTQSLETQDGVDLDKKLLLVDQVNIFTGYICTKVYVAFVSEELL